VILNQPELHLHGDVLVPDLAAWRRERLPELPEAAAFELAPDWACEVLSLEVLRLDGAGQRRRESNLSMRLSSIWARSGARRGLGGVPTFFGIISITCSLSTQESLIIDGPI
jgi:hypothetical protein